MSSLMSAAGTMELLELLLEIKAEGMANFREVNKNLESVAAASVLTATATERMASTSEEASRGLEEEAGALKEVKKQAAEASLAVTAYGIANKVVGGTLAGIWGILTAPRGWFQAIVTGLGVLMGPLLAFGGVLLASTAVMVGWLAGAAAMVALLGGLAIGFAAIGAAVMALGISGMGGFAGPTAAQVSSGASGVSSAQKRLFDAQQAVIDLQQQIDAQRRPETLRQHQQMEDLLRRQAAAQDTVNASLSKYGGLLAAQQTPIQKFKADATEVLDALKEASVPLAQMGLNFADQLLPFIQTQGEQIINWFGARLPGALIGIGQVITDLKPTFKDFQTFMGGLFDRFSPQFGPQFEGAIGVIIPAIKGLMGWLATLTDWFIKELPTFGPIVQTIFTFMGNMVEAAARTWASFADWGARTFWPLLKSIKAEWDKPGVGSGFMETLKADLPVILANFDTWVKNSPKWLPAILDIAGGIVSIATAASNALTALGGMIDRLTKWVDNNDFWAGLDRAIIATGTKEERQAANNDAAARAGKAAHDAWVSGGRKGPDPTDPTIPSGSGLGFLPPNTPQESNVNAAKAADLLDRATDVTDAARKVGTQIEATGGDIHKAVDMVGAMLKVIQSRREQINLTIQLQDATNARNIAFEAAQQLRRLGQT